MLFLALDMPYWLKSECKPKTRFTEVNINVVNEVDLQVFGSVSSILVGPSLGGHIALQYAVRFLVKSLLLVAPVRVFEAALAETYDRDSISVGIYRLIG